MDVPAPVFLEWNTSRGENAPITSGHHTDFKSEVNSNSRI